MSQQQEQLAVLEELEQRRRELEQRLRETQRSHTLQDDEAQSRPGLQESAAPPEVRVFTHLLNECGPETADTITLHLHKKT